MRAPRQVPDEAKSFFGRDAFLEERSWEGPRATRRRRRSKRRSRRSAILISVIVGLMLSAVLEVGLLWLSGAGL
jgi:hypothetical protein